MNHNFSPAFQTWINEGTRPASAQSLSSLLDESRSALKSIIDRIESGQIKMASPIENAAAQYANLRPSIVPAAKKPIYNRAPQATPAPVASKPAPSATVKPAAELTGFERTAAAFGGNQKPLKRTAGTAAELTGRDRVAAYFAK